MRPSLLFLGLAAGLASGCAGAAATKMSEVDIVVQSDLGDSAMIARLRSSWATGGAQLSIGAGAATPNPVLPMTLAFRSPQPPSGLDLQFQLEGQDSTGGGVYVVRSLLDVQLVDGQRLMLPLPLVAACACQGSTCPPPGNPDCEDLTAPALLPVDPGVAPVSQAETFYVD
jgi:hypothetical protein